MPYSIGAIAASPRFASNSEVWDGHSSGLGVLADGLKISTDGGATCSASIPAGSVTAIAFSPGFELGGYCDAFVGTTGGLFLKSCSESVPPSNVTPSAVSVGALAVARTGPRGTWGASSVGLLRCTQYVPNSSPPVPFFLQYNASGGSANPNIVAVCIPPTYSASGGCGTDGQSVIFAEHTLGVFGSADNGNSWVQVNYNSTWPSTATVNDLAITPKFAALPTLGDTTLFAATSHGLYRWDGWTTGWVLTNTDLTYDITHVYVPQTYDRSQAAGTFPYHTVFLSVDDARGPGLYYSNDDGAHIYKMVDTNGNVNANDITAIACSPRYGLTDDQLFVSRATTGVFFSTNAPPSTYYYFCGINGTPLSTDVRDLAVMPAYLSGGDTKLLAATDSGPFWGDFYHGNLSSATCTATCPWTASSFATSSGCPDTRSVAFGYLGSGQVAAVGTAEDGIQFSNTYGNTFTFLGTGYRSLPDDVWTTVAYARDTTYLFAASPTYGVFISRDKGGSFQPYNGAGCTLLNNGAAGFGNGFERLGADPNYSGWTDDALFVGTPGDSSPTSGTHCGGIFYRGILARYGTTPYYFDLMDFYPWESTNVTSGPFQKIVNFTNGNIGENIWASSTSDGSCTGLGEYVSPLNASPPQNFAPQNTGLPNNDATSVKSGQDTSGNPAPLTSGVTVAGSVAQYGWVNYYFVVPDGSAHLNVTLDLDSSTYDDDVYIRYAAAPTYSLWDYRPYYGTGVNEIVDIYPYSSPRPLIGGIWYISVNGYSAGTTTYHLTATLLTSLAASSENVPPAVPKLGPPLSNYGRSSSESRPVPEAPSGNTTWGTVNNSGVYKGTVTSTEAAPEAFSVTWEARNGIGSTALNLGDPTQTVVQLTDGTLLCGQQGAVWQSLAPDEGRTTWYNVQASLGGLGLPSNPNVVDFLWIPNGDVLVAVNGTAGTGGVWLSGDDGVDWMNISSGFDASSQKLRSLVVDNPSNTPPFYYAGTDSTGAYARTITPSPYPTVTSLSASSGPSSGGTALTVTGTGFLASCPTGNASDCPFSSPIVVFGTDYVGATYVSATQLSVKTPAHGSGVVPIKVINPDTRMASCACTFSFTGDTGLNFTVTRSGGYTFLNWVTSTQLTVQRATNPQFTSGTHAWSVNGANWTDTSSASTDGTLYFYRIQ